MSADAISELRNELRFLIAKEANGHLLSSNLPILRRISDAYIECAETKVYQEEILGLLRDDEVKELFATDNVMELFPKK